MASAQEDVAMWAGCCSCYQVWDLDLAARKGEAAELARAEERDLYYA